MTMRQPRLVGPQPQLRLVDESECLVAAQVICRGHQPTSVRAVAGAAARSGREHLMLRFGRVVIYLEDHEALAGLRAVVGQADELSESVFGPVEDAFTKADREARQRFERTGNAVKLRT